MLMYLRVFLPECHGVVVGSNACYEPRIAVGSSDIVQNIAMELPLILFSIMSQIIGIDEVPCYRINCESFSKASRNLLILAHAEDADFL